MVDVVKIICESNIVWNLMYDFLKETTTYKGYYFDEILYVNKAEGFIEITLRSCYLNCEESKSMKVDLAEFQKFCDDNSYKYTTKKG